MNSFAMCYMLRLHQILVQGMKMAIDEIRVGVHGRIWIRFMPFYKGIKP